MFMYGFALELSANTNPTYKCNIVTTTASSTATTTATTTTATGRAYVWICIYDYEYIVMYSYLSMCVLLQFHIKLWGTQSIFVIRFSRSHVFP